MTDTIDVAALVERYISRARELSDDGKLPWWKDLADLLQSQADALAEARRERDEDQDSALLVGAMGRTWKARATTAEASIATMREALEPFAEAAASYDPEEGDDAQTAWVHVFTIGSLRRARRALGGNNAE